MAVVFELVEVSWWVEHKINAKHHVSVDEVLEVCANGPQTVWHTDEEGRRRLLCRGMTDSRRSLRLVFFPLESEGDWRLASAYPDAVA